MLGIIGQQPGTGVEACLSLALLSSGHLNYSLSARLLSNRPLICGINLLLKSVFICGGCLLKGFNEPQSSLWLWEAASFPETNVRGQRDLAIMRNLPMIYESIFSHEAQVTLQEDEQRCRLNAWRVNDSDKSSHPPTYTQRRMTVIICPCLGFLIWWFCCQYSFNLPSPRHLTQMNIIKAVFNYNCRRWQGLNEEQCAASAAVYNKYMSSRLEIIHFWVLL